MPNQLKLVVVSWRSIQAVLVSEFDEANILYAVSLVTGQPVKNLKYVGGSNDNADEHFVSVRNASPNLPKGLKGYRISTMCRVRTGFLHPYAEGCIRDVLLQAVEPRPKTRKSTRRRK